MFIIKDEIMAIVNSVLGPINTEEMGITLMHEHIASLDMSMMHAYKDWCDMDETLDLFVKNVEAVKKYGVKTMVDPTPVNLGRDLQTMQEGARRAGINIICTTGLYFMEEPWIMRGTDVDCLASYFIRDLTEGIEGTDYKAGFIKVATDKYRGESEVNQIMMLAAAKASLVTGCPIMTHTQSKLKQGIYQQNIFLKAGVAPHKIYIGHTFDCMDEEYIMFIMDKGSYVGADQIGITHRNTTEQLANIISNLIKKGKGYEKHIFLSHDAGAASDYAYSFSPFKRDASRNTSIRDYCELFVNLLPMLRQRGITEEQINMMIIENPRRFFAGEPIK